MRNATVKRKSKKRKLVKPSRTKVRERHSLPLDKMSTRQIVRAINRQDATVAHAVVRELPAIERSADAIVHAISNGGRLIYVGAGTSGRLAALDALECPPTFGVSPHLVIALLAGGRHAFAGSVEGLEDNAAAGASDLASAHVTKRDLVVGIAASGTTPYVLGALKFAKQHGAVTVGITSSRGSEITRLANISIAVETGPEIVDGSTRMKAGTAQKMILNSLSTTSMIRLGHVYNQWMIDVAMTNKKLRRRGLRILKEASGAKPARAARALADSKGSLRVALVMLENKVTAGEAQRALEQAGGNLRRALRE
jgi:N-acetylmuramic acid 6-phosphate etherase